ncbi:MAG: hypothetical protein JXQ73_30685 [Phycisphaerae bacterium]|nr:hypothetical protein [Phycisphaerae bacterium]
MNRLTIHIPDDLDVELRKFCEQEGMSAEDAVCEILRRRLAVQRFRELARTTEEYARQAGYSSEEDIIEDAS